MDGRLARRARAGASALVILLMALTAGTSSCSPTEKPKRPLVLAFYHPWYGTPWGPSKEWRKWDSWKFPGRYDPAKVTQGWRRDIASADYPLIGPYDVTDPEIVRWHMRLAKAAGIDGFLASWWKTPTPDKLLDWQMGLFDKVLLPVAEQEDFKVAVIDECAHYIKDYDALVSRATTYLPKYAKSPAYLKVDGEPVWFVYQVWDDWLKPEEAREYCRTVEQKVGPVYWIFDRMFAVGTDDPKYSGATLTVKEDWLKVQEIDCLGSYSLYCNWRATEYAHIKAMYGDYVQVVRKGGKQVMLPIHPGHDNTAVSDEPYVVPRKNGEQYKTFIRAAKEVGPNIIVVCSWNEWFEMTEIEPSRTWKDPFLYLKLTAEINGVEWKRPPFPPLRSLDPLIVEHAADDVAASARPGGSTP